MVYIDRSIGSVRIGDEILVVDLQIDRFTHCTGRWDHPEMGGVVIGFDDLGLPLIKINQTPAAYENLKGQILMAKDYVFKWRKISFTEFEILQSLERQRKEEIIPI